MRIGIFDPYLDSLSGGEKYMLTVAACLAPKHDIFLLWDENESGIRKKAWEKLGINLSKVQFSKNIFSKNVSFFSRLKASKNYDRIIYLSDGSIPFVL